MRRLFEEWWSLLGQELRGYGREVFVKDLLAALTVSAVALPLALAFGVASGADAAAGLVTAILAGLVIGALGGAPYQISGPTGAMSAVLIVVVTRDGLPGLWLTGLMAGALMVLLGLFRLGRVVSLIPGPVITGFTSGIAVIIACGQIDNALGLKTPPAESVLAKLGVYLEGGWQPRGSVILITLAVMAIMVLWPRLPWGQRVPGALVAIVAATLGALAAGWEVPTIGSVPRDLLLADRLHPGAIPWSQAASLLVPALSVAALGTIESLLCGAVGGNMTGVRLHTGVELVAQGIGNMLLPFFGGVPATAAIARTSVNIKSGGVTRLVPILHGVALLLVALLLAPALERIPLAALAGVLIVTAWRMNEWSAIRFFFSRRLKHAIAAFTVTLLATVLLDLTQAIIIGFGISTLIFMAQMSDLFVTRQEVDTRRLEAAGHRFAGAERPIVVYYVSGPMFFAAARKLVDQIEEHDPGRIHLILSLRGVPLLDATGIEVLRELLVRQRKGDGKLLLSGVQPRVEALLRRTGFLEDLGEGSVYWSADRAILSLGAPLPEGTAVESPAPDATMELAIPPSGDGEVPPGPIAGD